MKNNKNFSIKKNSILNEVLIIKPSNFTDNRGKIWTSWNNKILNNTDFNLDKFTISKKNVLRGFHGDNKAWKLVSCVYGEALAVVVDYRKNSPNLYKSFKIKLNNKNNYSILIPPNFLNSWLCLSNECIYHYKYSFKGSYYDVEKQITVPWNSDKLKIKWPIKKPILSARENF